MRDWRAAQAESSAHCGAGEGATRVGFQLVLWAGCFA